MADGSGGMDGHGSNSLTSLTSTSKLLLKVDIEAAPDVEMMGCVKMEGKPTLELDTSIEENALDLVRTPKLSSVSAGNGVMFMDSPSAGLRSNSSTPKSRKQMQRMNSTGTPKRGSIMGIRMNSFAKLERSSSKYNLDIGGDSTPTSRGTFISVESRRSTSRLLIDHDALSITSSRSRGSNGFFEGMGAAFDVQLTPKPSSPFSSSGKKNSVSFSRLNTGIVGVEVLADDSLSNSYCDDDGEPKMEVKNVARKRIALTPTSANRRKSTLAPKFFQKPGQLTRRQTFSFQEKEFENTLLDDLRRFYGTEDAAYDLKTTPSEHNLREQLNSDKMLLMRESIRFSPRIRALLTMVWLAADADHSGKLDEDEYLELNHKLQIAVIGHFDPVEGMEMAKKDWDIDRQGLDHLNYARFSQSWFQIVDLWTDDVDETVYYDFLYQLTQRMLETGPDGSLRFRDDKNIVCQEAYELAVAKGKWKEVECCDSPMEIREKYGVSVLQAKAKAKAKAARKKRVKKKPLLNDVVVKRPMSARLRKTQYFMKKPSFRFDEAQGTECKIDDQESTNESQTLDELHHARLRNIQRQRELMAQHRRQQRQQNEAASNKRSLMDIVSDMQGIRIGGHGPTLGRSQSAIDLSLNQTIVIAKPVRDAPYITNSNCLLHKDEQSDLLNMLYKDEKDPLIQKRIAQWLGESKTAAIMGMLDNGDRPKSLLLLSSKKNRHHQSGLL